MSRFPGEPYSSNKVLQEIMITDYDKDDNPELGNIGNVNDNSCMSTITQNHHTQNQFEGSHFPGFLDMDSITELNRHLRNQQPPCTYHDQGESRYATQDSHEHQYASTTYFDQETMGNQCAQNWRLHQQISDPDDILRRKYTSSVETPVSPIYQSIEDTYQQPASHAQIKEPTSSQEAAIMLGCGTIYDPVHDRSRTFWNRICEINRNAKCQPILPDLEYETQVDVSPYTPVDVTDDDTITYNDNAEEEDNQSNTSAYSGYDEDLERVKRFNQNAALQPILKADPVQRKY
ncbi:uncharacterized protein L201_000852 [Kwoniella dendrophila CBS 6074]|uniref:Uncharacterized protein n=1 Tax=Kwoniella dendrophila CBS 6074 TaxID=1295534 RepID=A0AAX4JKQ0_9TREE